MFKLNNRASLVSLAAGLSILAYGALGSGAAAQLLPAPAKSEPVNLLPAPLASASTEGVETDVAPAPVAEPVAAASLADLVARQASDEELPQQLKCMAGAIYFEAGHEKLVGQLAVGRVIVARSRSGRFPDSYCGVVYQRSQFSFIHGNAMPAIKTNSVTWRNAVAIARIAHEGSWQSPTEGAMYFHSVHVSPKWANRTRVARLDNHIFYR